MKILYLIEERFPPFRVDIVELFACQLTDLGYDVDWLMQRGDIAVDAPKIVTWHNTRIFLSPHCARKDIIGRILNHFLNIFGDLKVFPLAVRNRYDIIQVRNKFAGGLMALLAARATGAKFCYWIPYPLPEEWLYMARSGLSRYPFILRCKGHLARVLLYRLLLPCADHIFVQSEQMRDDIAAEGIDGRKMTPVLMGIRADRILSADDATAPDPQNPTLLYLGTLFRVRQLDFVIRVLALVKKRFPGTRLKMIGEGYDPMDRQILDDEIERQDLRDSVVFPGFLPIDEALREVRQADICLSPFAPVSFLQSTSPTKLIEYLAMAKLVVANHHPEQSSVLEDSGVSKSVAWDEQAFSEEICRLLEDPEGSRRKAGKGPEYVRQNRTYEEIARMVDEIYKKVLA